MSDAEYFKPAKEAVNDFINIQNTWTLWQRQNATNSAMPWEYPLAATRLCHQRVCPQGAYVGSAWVRAPHTCVLVWNPFPCLLASTGRNWFRNKVSSVCVHNNLLPLEGD